MLDPNNAPGGWYSGPDASVWNPPVDKWYLWAGNGGIDVSGVGGWNDLEHYCIYNGNFNPPTIKTILTGLIPGQTYKVWIVYGVTSTPGLGGVWAGLGPNTTDWNWYNSLNGTDTGVWVPGRTGGDPPPSQQASLGEAVATGGQITVWIGYGQTTFYDGLSYKQVTACDSIQDQGWTIIGDLNADCYVNLADFAEMAADWARCIEPSDPSCDHPWLNP